MRSVVLLQDEVGCVAGSIPTNQHRNLLVGQPRLGGFAATFARCSWHGFLLALEGFKEKGFICFRYAHQTGGLATVGFHKKAMPPAKCSVAMHVAGLGAFAHALALFHLLCVVQPFVFHAQSRQGCSRQGIEGRLASRTAVALQSGCTAPVSDFVVSTLGTHCSSQCTALNQSVDRLYVFNLAEALCQKFPLMWCQLVNFCRQRLEVLFIHGSTYLID